MRYDDRDLERLLRTALQEEADRQHPAGDGLTRIRERVTGRRRWRLWVAPTLALAGAAAVIATAVAAPSYLTGSRAEPQLIQPGGEPVPLSPTPGEESPTAVPYGSPGTPYGGEADLKDMATVWPYPSRRTGTYRADQDVRTGVRRNLADPAQTAIDFIASFVGNDGELEARKVDPYAQGLRMLVFRQSDAGEVPVSTVFLVRVRKGDDAPYVVVGASRARISDRDSLTISQPPKLVGTSACTVTGLARGNQGLGDRTVIVQLREPGSTEVLAQQAAAVRFGDEPLQTWTADLTPLRALPSTGVMAAWTLDAEGKVVEFVAAPTDQ